MINLYFICGLPGSGKTTLAYKIAEQNNAIVHSFDDIPGAWGNVDRDNKFFEQWISEIKTDIENNKNVVLDCIALGSGMRKGILKRFSDFELHKILVFKATPLEECIKRNKNRERVVPENRIREGVLYLQAPTKDEGWDEIYINKN